jgi:hypothetical protein
MNKANFLSLVMNMLGTRIAHKSSLVQADSQDMIPIRVNDCLFDMALRLTLGPTHSPLHWVPGSCSTWLMQPEHEAVFSRPANAEVKNVWNFGSSPLLCCEPG